MTPQRLLFDDINIQSIVNVASVPQLSPFRYPGGKTWLVPQIREWLKSINRPIEFIEPFAGGGIVSLTVASEDLADQITMVELDEQVAAVWECLIKGHAKALSTRVVNFDLTLENLNAELARPVRSIINKAFHTILKNRTYHGGILAPGSAPLKYGENGKGIQSRWYPETLKKRFLKIDSFRSRLQFIQGDGIEVIEKNISRPDVVFFVDPPYSAPGKSAGRRLYNHFALDHEKVFSLLSKAQGDVLITYDDAFSVRALATRHGFEFKTIAMKNTHHAKMNELLIGKKLSWLKAE